MVVGRVAALFRARESPDQGGPRVCERTWDLAHIVLMAETQRRDGPQVAGRGGTEGDGRRERTIAAHITTVMCMPNARPSQVMQPPSLTCTRYLIVRRADHTSSRWKGHPDHVHTHRQTIVPSWCPLGRQGVANPYDHRLCITHDGL